MPDEEAARILPGDRGKWILPGGNSARPSLSWSIVLVAALLGVGNLVDQPSEASDLESTSELAEVSADDEILHTSTWKVSQPVASYPSSQADTALHGLSGEAGDTANWVNDSGNNRGMPFVIVDKIDAMAFVFGADGKLQGSAPVLLGLAPGDSSVPGVGDRAISRIRPEERTTPAGRFIASLGKNARGKEILWVDYVNAISMHPVITTSAEERRAQRLATPTPLDNRISYGCINVPPEFFHEVVSRSFAGTSGVVYVLPETGTARELFSMD